MQTATPNLSLTVYNGGYGLVKDVRRIALKEGRQVIPVPNVAARIEPDSVAIRSLSAPGSFVVMEQNYRYDLISPRAILAKALGEEVTLVQVMPDGKVTRLTGTLLSAPLAEGSLDGVVIREPNGNVILNPRGTIEVKSIPADLVSRPTLFWDLDAEKAGENQVELSYLTGGISWTANYVLLLSDDGNSGDLKGWVTMDNKSGTSYENCRIKLLAGDVNRAPMRAGRPASADMMRVAEAKAEMNQEQFGEYHLYTLPRPATVLNNEMKQLSLLEASAIKLKKEITFDAMRNYGGYRADEGEIGTGPIKPLVQYVITNSKKDNLGMPLPAGKFKLYQRDSEGATQLVGEDAIDHTPSDETIKITVGRAFDIVAERKRVSYKAINEKGRQVGAEEIYEIQLRNRKKVAETVRVIERFWGEYKITTSTDKYTKPDANTVLFTVPLKAGEVRTIKYEVETRWGR